MRTSRATPAQISTFLAAFFPQVPRDVDWMYHTPQARTVRSYVTSIILSITPTQGVYTAMNEPDLPPTIFLHRPFNLDRRQVRAGVQVLACHKGFDEVLTVGINPVLARRLQMNMDEEEIQIISGYKSDPTRKLGYAGPLTSPLDMAGITAIVHNEFGHDVGKVYSEQPLDHKFSHLALMNAFSQATVDQVLACTPDGRALLYVTGEARQEGLDAAAAAGMSVLTLGHREVEEWGLRYLAHALKCEFGDSLNVVTVMEDEPSMSKQGAEHQVQM